MLGAPRVHLRLPRMYYNIYLSSIENVWTETWRTLQIDPLVNELYILCYYHKMQEKIISLLHLTIIMPNFLP